MIRRVEYSSVAFAGGERMQAPAAVLKSQLNSTSLGGVKCHYLLREHVFQ